MELPKVRVPPIIFCSGISHSPDDPWYIYLQNWVIKMGFLCRLIYQHHGSSGFYSGFKTLFGQLRVPFYSGFSNEQLWFFVGFPILNHPFRAYLPCRNPPWPELHRMPRWGTFSLDGCARPVMSWSMPSACLGRCHGKTGKLTSKECDVSNLS